MTNLITAIDTSSAQNQDLTALIGQYLPDHVVVKLYQRVEARFRPWTLRQAASAKAAGCSVGGYVWLYRDVDPVQQVQDALEIAALAGIELPILWLDCETYTDGTYPSVAQVAAAVDEAERQHARVGIYTGAWFWRGYMKNTPRFADLPLWDATYDNSPTLDGLAPYGGWTARAGHQYSGNPIDRSVFDEGVTVVQAPAPPNTYSVGPGILASMQAAGDSPAGDELYHQSSFAVGASGARYVYLNSDNRTYRVQP